MKTQGNNSRTALTQHSIDLDTQVPVIEAWDTTLSVYDSALSTELVHREARTRRLEDACTRTRAKQQRNAQEIQIPTVTRRGLTLAKRVARSTAKIEQLREGTGMLQEQQEAVRAYLNSIPEYTSKVEEEVMIVRDLIRENAREMIQALGTQEQVPQSAPAVAAAAEEPVARHLAFGNQPPRQDGTQQTVKDETVHLNVDGRHWPQLAGARGAGRQRNYRDPHFDEPL